jgi:F-type H+-transporting ATPase subunit delta
MKNVRVARRYARALMEIAEEQKVVDDVARDLTDIGASLATSHDLRVLLSSPVVREGKKKAVFRELWETRVNRTTMAFILLLTHKQREQVLGDVIGEYQALRDEKRGVVGADVRTAVAMSAAQEQDLGARLTRSTGKQVRIRLSVDPAIQGGLVVRLGDTVVDASVRRQLERLRERFRAGESLTNTHA